MKNSNGVEKCEDCEFCSGPIFKEDKCVCKLTRKIITASKMHPRCPFIEGSDLAFLVNTRNEKKID